MNKIFISYSHEDQKWKELLVKQLKVLEKHEQVILWDDRMIEAGVDWVSSIKEAIETSRIFIMLISVDFLTSHFILNEEIPRILKRRQKEGAFVIPVIVRPCTWKKIIWLSKLQVFPPNAEPLSEFPKRKRDKI